MTPMTKATLFLTAMLGCFCLLSCGTTDIDPSTLAARGCTCQKGCTLQFAEVATDKVSGTVTGPAGEPAVNVCVTLGSYLNSEIYYLARTNDKGVFTFSRVQEGAFYLTVYIPDQCCIAGFVEVRKGPTVPLELGLN